MNIDEKIKLLKSINKDSKCLKALMKQLVRNIERKAEINRKIKTLWKTGCITQAQLAKIFHQSQSNISRIISEGEE